MIDRVAPSARPAGRNSGTQVWESLLFCHWEVPIESVRARLPAGLEVDTFNGRTFIGVVPFKMRQIRPSWLPRALAFNFLETNVRTYVVHEGRPGVYFFSLDASSRLAVWAARVGWSLPYWYSRMDEAEDQRSCSYESKRPNGTGKLRVQFRIGQSLGPLQPGTLEHFLLERYLLFVQHRHTIYTGQVHHTPYPAHVAEVESIENQLTTAAGFSAISGLPELAHYSPGVSVEVFALTKSK
jgi:uncharacterized protein